MRADGSEQEHRLTEALREGLGAGDAPVPSLPGVQRRADARRRRQVAGSVSAVVAVVAVVLGVALVVPGGATRDGDAGPAVVADGPAPEAPVTGTAADFTDPAVWPLLQPLPVETPVLTDADLDEALPGMGGWGVALIDWAAGWDAMGCSDEAWLFRPEAHGGLAPRDQVLSTWSAADLDEASTGRLVIVEAYRWPSDDGDGVRRAAAWGQEQADVAARCSDGVPLESGGLPGDEAVVRVTVPGSTTAGAAPDVWSVTASTTGGPTALRVTATVVADTSQQAADRAVALVARLVERLTAADASAVRAARAPAARPALGADHLLQGLPRSSAGDVGVLAAPAPLDDAVRADGVAS